MPKISLCMIVRNEEKFLEQCLNSVKELVDEIIIVDTGSTDRTKEIAARFTDKVFDFKWADDFSAARNESLKWAKGDWILVLDADEVIAKEDLTKIRKLVENQEAVGYILIQRNYFKSLEELDYGSFGGIRVKGSNESETGFVLAEGDSYNESKGMAGWLPTPIVRLFRKAEGAAFSGRVHEDISFSLKGKIVNTDLPIHHFGKLDPLAWKAKGQLYEELGEKKAAEEGDYFAYYELGRQYLANRKLDLAKEMFLNSISLNEGLWASWYSLGSLELIKGDWALAVKHLEKAKGLNQKVVWVYINLGAAYARKREFGLAIENFEAAIRLNPKEASAYKNLGMCYHEQGNREKAYTSFKKAIELNPKYKEIIRLG